VKRGRPPIPPEQRRTQYVGVRFRRDELERLYSVSRQMRMDVGEFIRKCTLSNYEHPKNPAIDSLIYKR
jgi:hypothetical protein